MTSKKIIDELAGNVEFKQKFIAGLNKLGFPLEFKIRAKLVEKGYNAVREGFFTAPDEYGREVTRTFDIHAYKDKREKILKNVTINLSLNIIGECKYSSDSDKLLFAIPDMSNPGNKLFVCPILTSFQSAQYGVYRNSEVRSNFVSKYGDLFIASDVKDTSKDHIITGHEEHDKKTPEYEKIFNIAEATILPALKQNFIRWRSFAYIDYSRSLANVKRDVPAEDFINLLEGQYYSGKILLPVIISSKPILRPIVNEKSEVLDVEELKFILYEHSALRPNEYPELLSQCYDLGVFVCNEAYFDDFMSYVENLFDKVFNEIVTNLKKHPFRLVDDFNEIQRQDDELQKLNGVGSILPLKKKQE